MKDEQYLIAVDDLQKRLIIKALKDLREKQIDQNKSYDFLDELILRVCDAVPARWRPYGESV
ncbi:MAG: hypothetical protein II004_01815 [Erysipelotrichaceae bacterium]|jgi:hypothetical protein|nr:hypothetical protein [Erysipelotrichaceae bacterium]